ncbi:MAG: YkgJ family cysteine cluster protein [Desulfobacteraceae bacterium]|nr:YkgJ family cysteine cluster protein [Desulfobacteraceae bacterium]
MTTADKMASIDPVKVGPDSKFKFKCHKEVKCFTKCCRGINIVLTPYDIIRLKNRLELSAENFLALYTEPHMLEKTDLPVITLKLLNDEGADPENLPCPFVREDGCIVYEDRPTSCRYYPLGTASLSHKQGADDEDFYFFVNEPHCLGFEEEKEWTVHEWRKDQGVDIHDEINAEWTDLIVRKRSFPPNIKLSEQSKNMFFLASYNIDKFRDFVFESTFLERYDIDKETVEKIKKDEIELLKFGVTWLKSVLFQGAFKPGEE